MYFDAFDRKENVEKAAKKAADEKAKEEKKRVYVKVHVRLPSHVPEWRADKRFRAYIPLHNEQCPPPSLPLPLTQHRPRPTLSRTSRHEFHQFQSAEQVGVGSGDDGLFDGEM